MGAALQVQAVGGPHPQSSIEYMLLDTAGNTQTVATVSSSGLVESSAIGMVTKCLLSYTSFLNTYIAVNV